MKLYHYTTEESAMAIQSTMVIYKSSDMSGDAFHGDGVYLTAIRPDVTRALIIWNNWDDGRRVIKR